MNVSYTILVKQTVYSSYVSMHTLAFFVGGGSMRAYYSRGGWDMAENFGVTFIIDQRR